MSPAWPCVCTQLAEGLAPPGHSLPEGLAEDNSAVTPPLPGDAATASPKLQASLIAHEEGTCSVPTLSPWLATC